MSHEYLPDDGWLIGRDLELADCRIRAEKDELRRLVHRLHSAAYYRRMRLDGSWVERHRQASREWYYRNPDKVKSRIAKKRAKRKRDREARAESIQCPICKGWLWTADPRRRYCSPECRRRAEIIRQRRARPTTVIRELLRGDPWLPPRVLSELSGLPRESVQRALRTLERSGRVRATAGAREPLYALARGRSG